MRLAAAAFAVCVGCDAPDTEAPPPTATASTAFRCATGNVPGVGGLNTATINGAAIISGLGGEFDLFSNGTIQVAGTALVTGGAYSVVSNIELFNFAVVTGLPSPDATTTGEIPPWIPTDEIAYIETYRENADIGPTFQGRNALSNGDSDLTLYGGDTLVLDPGFYAFDSINLSGGSTLAVRNWAFITLDGPLTVSGGSQITVPDPRDLLLVSGSSGAIDFSGGSDVSMRLYAPLAPITISGFATRFTGGALGATLQLSYTSTMEVTEDALHIWHPC